MNPIDDVSKLIGRPINGPDVETLLNRLDADAERVERDGKAYWLSEDAGLEVHADAETRCITIVFAYAGGYDDFSRFTGDLPAGLSIDMTRNQVQSRLGAPDKSGPVNDAWGRPTHWIMVEYTSSGEIKIVAFTGH